MKPYVLADQRYFYLGAFRCRATGPTTKRPPQERSVVVVKDLEQQFRSDVAIGTPKIEKQFNVDGIGHFLSQKGDRNRRTKAAAPVLITTVLLRAYSAR